MIKVDTWIRVRYENDEGEEDETSDDQNVMDEEEFKNDKRSPPRPVNLPDGYVRFEGQAGGHHPGQGGGKIGVIRDTRTGRILKHMPYSHSRGEAEFYESMLEWERNGEFEWPPFIPRYYGTRSIRIDGMRQAFIELDDATASLVRPNILDVKLGGTERRGDTPERIAVRRAKYPFYQEMGFRLDGCLVHRSADQYERYSAKANKTRRQLSEAVRAFLRTDEKASDAEALVRSLRTKLEEIAEWMKAIKWKFYSTSILMAYESDGHVAECRVALIDFLYVYPSKSPDQKCLRGLQRLIGFLEEMVADGK